MAASAASRGVRPALRYILWFLAGGLLILLWQPLSKLAWQVLFGVLLAAAALPIARWLEKRMRPSLAALGAILSLGLCLVGILALLLPHLIAQVSFIIAQAPQWIGELRQLWQQIAAQEWAIHFRLNGSMGEDWLGKITAWLGQNLPRFLSALGTLADGLSRAFLSPLLAYYFLRDREEFTYRLSLWIPFRHRKRLLTALQEMRREAWGYLRGQLLVALAVGGLTAAGLLLVGAPAWLALGLLMGLCELIPYIGPFIGAVPIALFSWPMGLSTLLWALGVAIAVQQIEGYFLSPHLMAGATGLHPVYVLLLLSAGGLLWGVLGMVIALPLFVCVRGAARVLYETREKENVNLSGNK